MTILTLLNYIYFIQKIRAGNNSSWEAGTFMLNQVDSNITPENFSIKCDLLYERRVAQVFSSRIKWNIHCYTECSRMVDGYKETKILCDFVNCFKQRSVEGIIEILAEGLLYNKQFMFYYR